jgi:hypothetical protein
VLVRGWEKIIIIIKMELLICDTAMHLIYNPVFCSSFVSVFESEVPVCFLSVVYKGIYWEC